MPNLFDEWDQPMPPDSRRDAQIFGTHRYSEAGVEPTCLAPCDREIDVIAARTGGRRGTQWLMLTYHSPSSMNTRVELFLVALAILALARLAQTLSQRREHPFFDSARVMFAASSTRQLVLASFLTLFAELAFIRWIAVEAP